MLYITTNDYIYQMTEPWLYHFPPTKSRAAMEELPQERGFNANSSNVVLSDRVQNVHLSFCPAVHT